MSHPGIDLAPLIALWFGTGLLSKLVICALIVFFPVAVATTRFTRSSRSRRSGRWSFCALSPPMAMYMNPGW